MTRGWRRFGIKGLAAPVDIWVYASHHELCTALTSNKHSVAPSASWRREIAPGQARMVLRPYGASPLRERGHSRPRRRPSRFLRRGRNPRELF